LVEIKLRKFLTPFSSHFSSRKVRHWWMLRYNTEGPRSTIVFPACYEITAQCCLRNSRGNEHWSHLCGWTAHICINVRLLSARIRGVYANGTHVCLCRCRTLSKANWTFQKSLLGHAGKYSRVCYNERIHNERMLQRTVFINKMRMLQRTRRNAIGRRSTRVRMTCRAFPLWLERKSLSLLSFVRFSYQFSSVICLFATLAVKHFLFNSAI